MQRTSPYFPNNSAEFDPKLALPNLQLISNFTMQNLADQALTRFESIKVIAGYNDQYRPKVPSGIQKVLIFNRWGCDPDMKRYIQEGLSCKQKLDDSMVYTEEMIRHAIMNDNDAFIDEIMDRTSNGIASMVIEMIFCHGKIRFGRRLLRRIHERVDTTQIAYSLLTFNYTGMNRKCIRNIVRIIQPKDQSWIFRLVPDIYFILAAIKNKNSRMLLRYSFDTIALMMKCLIDYRYIGLDCVEWIMQTNIDLFQNFLNTMVRLDIKNCLYEGSPIKLFLYKSLFVTNQSTIAEWLIGLPTSMVQNITEPRELLIDHHNDRLILTRRTLLDSLLDQGHTAMIRNALDDSRYVMILDCIVSMTSIETYEQLSARRKQTLIRFAKSIDSIQSNRYTANLRSQIEDIEWQTTPMSIHNLPGLARLTMSRFARAIHARESRVNRAARVNH